LRVAAVAAGDAVLGGEGRGPLRRAGADRGHHPVVEGGDARGELGGDAAGGGDAPPDRVVHAPHDGPAGLVLAAGSGGQTPDIAARTKGFGLVSGHMSSHATKVVTLEPTRRRLSGRQAATVDELIAAAGAELAAGGYESLTVRRVARRAGVAPAT